MMMLPRDSEATSSSVLVLRRATQEHKTGKKKCDQQAESKSASLENSQLNGRRVSGVSVDPILIFSLCLFAKELGKDIHHQETAN
jgi:hypothetical protein